MKVTDFSSINWSERIKSDSRNVDLLGIWSQHLKIQVDFTPGITSVTNRIRYYTLIAYYFEYLKNIVPDRFNFERIFILSCLAHHNGDDKPLNGVHNKTKFRNNWDEKNNFSLNFKITGQGWSYYVRQLEVLRCAWKDELGENQFSKTNAKLANSLENVNPQLFRDKIYQKDKLKLIGEKGLCICNTGYNITEKDVMSKLLFGFFSKKDGEWDIDEDEYQMFKEGYINLAFEDIECNLFLDSEIIEKNLKRRNTLFMFLKIVNETNPPLGSSFNRYIWDSIYFDQNRDTHNLIIFDKLEPIKKYWELLQLNVYYIYTLEKYLDLIDDIIIDYEEDNLIAVLKEDIIKYLEFESVFSYLENIIDTQISRDYTIMEFIKLVNNLNSSVKTNLDSLINESQIFDNIADTNGEERLSNILIMVSLLFNRYSSIEEKIKNYAIRDHKSESYSLFIEDIFAYIEKKGDELTIFQFLDYLSNLIIKKHLHESTIRLYDSGTKNWLFMEEDGLLYSEKKLIHYYSRDNRWDSIKSLLSDLGFFNKSGDKLELSERGVRWLKRVE